MNNEELKIIKRAYNKLSRLEQDIKNRRRAQNNVLQSIQNIMGRFCDDKGVKEAKDERISELIQQGKDIIKELRSLLKNS